MFQKKSLGQNFLKSPKIIADIVRAGNINEGENVLEVGPGEGTLTEALLKAGAKVVAIEKDQRLIPILKQKFAPEVSSGNLTLIEADILTINPSNLFLNPPYKLIANIPYYITGILIRKFLTASNQPSRIVLMVQKEVAERIVARDGKESLLSLGVKAYGTPKYVATVSKGNFSPVPNVDSAILEISGISRNNFKNTKHEEIFFKIAKKAFGQKRKMLAGTLKIGNEILKQVGINPTIRPEDLTIKQWTELSEKISG